MTNATPFFLPDISPRFTIIISVFHILGARFAQLLLHALMFAHYGMKLSFDVYEI